MKGGLALDALRNVDGELDTVVAKGVGGCGSVDRSATVTAQNTAGFISIYFLGWYFEVNLRRVGTVDSLVAGESASNRHRSVKIHGRHC